MTFHKIEDDKKRSFSVADQILDAVNRGTYKKGSRLPPERELARIMGVSRNSVREGISALQLAGFINTRVGDGNYITQSAAPPRPLVVSKRPKKGVELLGIWKARNEIEQTLLQIALERATKVDLEELRIILSDMSIALAERSSPKFSLSDVAFHLRISDVSNDLSLARAERQLLNVSRQFYRVLDYSETPRTQSHLERSFATHRGIFDAIENRDVIAASRAQKEHFKEIISYLNAASEHVCDFCLSPLVEPSSERLMLK